VSTDKVAALVEAFAADAAKIKAAMKVQRERVKGIQVAITLGLLTDEQVETVSAILPKPRAAKGEAAETESK